MNYEEAKMLYVSGTHPRIIRCDLRTQLQEVIDPCCMCDVWRSGNEWIHILEEKI
jgi:hypothetical protein